jgi:hypothetical protein
MRLKKIEFEIICHNLKTAHIITSHEINERLMMPCYEYSEYLNAKPLKLPPTMPLIFSPHTPDNMVHLHPVSRNIGHQETVLCTPIAFVSCDRPRYHLGIPTAQQKHSSCHSDPKAFTTVSVTGFRHFLHLVE